LVELKTFTINLQLQRTKGLCNYQSLCFEKNPKPPEI
jgi:hypothetical protein